MKNKLSVLIFLASSIASFYIQAASPAPTKTSLAAHVHGLSELTLVIEGPALEIQLTSPAMDLVGFEHQASTPKNIMAVEKAVSILRQHDTLFLLPNITCQHVNTSIDVAALLPSDDRTPSPHNASNDEHEHDESHSAITANYQYHCKNSSALSSMSVKLFDFFPGIHKIQTRWIHQSQQGAVTLTENNPTIQF